MSYENFKPEVWSKKVQLELEKLMVFRDICNTQFQGDVGRGKTVKIIGVDRPKVNTYVPGTDILDAETPQDSSVYLAVDQFKYTHFMVDDIDGMQGDTPIMEHLMHGSATALAEAADAYIAEKVKEAGIVIPSQAISTAAQAKEALDEAFERLSAASPAVRRPVHPASRRAARTVAAINRACFIAVTAGGPPRISGICPPFGASVHWCGAFCRPARRGAAPRGPLPCASPARSSRRTGGRCRQRSRRR